MTRGRTALLAAHALALVGCGLLVRAIAADAHVEPPAPAPAGEAAVALGAGEWVFDGAEFGSRRAPAAAFEFAPRVAARVSAGDRVAAELYGPLDPAAAAAAWRAGGWDVQEVAGPRPRFDVRKGDRALTAWRLESTRGGACLLVAPAAEPRTPEEPNR